VLAELGGTIDGATSSMSASTIEPRARKRRRQHSFKVK
jgi:hypothetical protein